MAVSELTRVEQSAEPASVNSRSRDLLTILTVALTVRAIFLVLTADTYDYDEFVLLLLGRDFAAGAVPYRDFMFFHPPGILLLLRGLEPLTQLWWPLARLLMIVVDTASAVLVWRIGTLLWNRRVGLIAGILYALSPLALVSSVRVGQDPIITCLGLAGLTILLSRRDHAAAIAAGCCLALAVWIKYPALYFLPVYMLAAPRRAPLVIASVGAALAGLFAPFHTDFGALYHQTVVFQRTRWTMAPAQRLGTLGLFWLVVNPLALPGAIRRPRPLWLLAGFFLGLVYVLPSQVYYHYFVVVVPFGALLSAPLLDRFSRVNLRRFAAVGMGIALGWAALLDLGGPSPLYVTAAHLSDLAPTIRVIDRDTGESEPVLGDRYEYAYLARRPAVAHYFWNVGVLVDADYLEQRLPPKGVVVLSYGASSGFPSGFIRYLNQRFHHLETPANTLWTVSAVR